MSILIVIVNNLSVRKKWSKSINITQGFIVDRVIGFFKGRFNLSLYLGGEIQSFEIKPDVTIDIKDSCEVVIEPIEGKVKIDKLFLTVIDMPEPEKIADVSKIRIIHHPEQDVIIALDFTEMLKEIRDIPFPEIEILNPDNTRFLVDQSSEIFQWRKDTEATEGEEYLYCKLTVGERRLRVRFVDNQSWSAWLPFTCMSKKRYRLLK